MAIIKCPECGRQISDKAPVCPNCGVEIAGKIIRCTRCGDVYFKNQPACPNCHHATPAEETTTPPSPLPQTPTERPKTSVPSKENTPPHSAQSGKQNTKPRKGSKWMIFLVALTIAIAICGVCFYFYHRAKQSKEQEAYAYAIQSNDPLVLQTYLDNNVDAPQAHLDSIQARMVFLKQLDTDWHNAVVNGTKAALQAYINKHPGSEHTNEANRKIDSIDWAAAVALNTEDGVQLYLTQHADGHYVDEANQLLRDIKANTVSYDEKEMVIGALQNFFNDINEKDGDNLVTRVTPIMTSFLGRSSATREDLLTYLKKIYAPGVDGMEWTLKAPDKIEKKEVADDTYEYTVTLPAVQKVEHADNITTTNYQIKAVVNPEGLISSMSMTKLNSTNTNTAI